MGIHLKIKKQVIYKVTHKSTILQHHGVTG